MLVRVLLITRNALSCGCQSNQTGLTTGQPSAIVVATFAKIAPEVRNASRSSTVIPRPLSDVIAMARLSIPVAGVGAAAPGQRSGPKDRRSRLPLHADLPQAARP